MPELLLTFLQPLQSGTDPAEGGEVIQRLGWQVVAFIKHVHGVGGRREDGTPAQGQVCQLISCRAVSVRSKHESANVGMQTYEFKVS